MAQLNFDANNVAPREAREPLPAGWYNMKIVDSEQKPTKRNDGSYLELVLQVIDGQYANRKVWHRLNLNNINPTAVEIAQQELRMYCEATGIMQVADSQQLHGIPIAVKVGVEKDPNGQYEDSNGVKNVVKVGGGQPGTQAAVPQQAAPQQRAPAPQPQAAPAGWGAPPPTQPAPQQTAQPMQPAQQPAGGGVDDNTQAPADEPPPWARQG